MNPESGLPEEVFLEVSSVMPIPNVDLLVTDDNNQILLSWRDDPFYGQGWHLPGGCIRFKESMADRIHKTALAEIGCDVLFDKEPLAVRDVIVDFNRPNLHDQSIRAHNLAILYKCKLTKPDIVEIFDSHAGERPQRGELRWFNVIPSNILSVHTVYNDVFTKYGLMKTDE